MSWEDWRTLASTIECDIVWITDCVVEAWAQGADPTSDGWAGIEIERHGRP